MVEKTSSRLVGERQLKSQAAEQAKLEAERKAQQEIEAATQREREAKEAQEKYNRAMQDGFMVKPSKPQAIRNSELLLNNKQKSIRTKPSTGFCVAIIAIFTLLLLPAFVR